MEQLDGRCRNRGEKVTEVSYNKYRLETKEQRRLGAHVHRFRDLSRKGNYEVEYTVTAADLWSATTVLVISYPDTPPANTKICQCSNVAM